MFSRHDLRPVVQNPTRVDTGEYRVVYKNHFGETREIPHLGFNEAYERKRSLKSRGYKVSIEVMAYAARETWA